MSAAKVQLECKWINISQLIHTHHTLKHIIYTQIQMHVSHMWSVWTHALCTAAHVHVDTWSCLVSQINTLSHTLGAQQGHLCLCVFPLLSTWLCCAPHCAPGMPAIWNQTPMDQHPAGAIHCSFSGATTDAEDIPLGTHRHILCNRKFYLFIAVIAKLWLCPLFFVAGGIFQILWRIAPNTQSFLLRQCLRSDES